MLRKTFAALFVILAVLPFTAPFSVFDLAHGAHSSTTSLGDGSRGLPTLAASARTRIRLAGQLAISGRNRGAQSSAVHLGRRPNVEHAPLVPRSRTVLRI